MQLVRLRAARQVQVAAAFGVNPDTVWRWDRALAAAGGVGALFPARSGPRDAWWTVGGRHYFNAVNDNGLVKAVDGQSGSVEPWPPSPAGLGFDESYMAGPAAIFFGSNGKVAVP